MRSRTPLTLFLVVSGLALLAVGAALSFSPATLHALNGVELGGDASLLSEIRAPGAALLATGALTIAAVFVSRLAYPALIAGAVVYVAYGLGRILSIAVDGMPASPLVVVTFVELALGALSIFMLSRYFPSARQAVLPA
ncbi:DUF4345 domain-containing protein [Sinosporangium siamense]|uniref:DUF4345 domain-containing protein n=1 Tax=Sinosporangium siamense TaxID=1367973 RepID=A0A919VBV9_9ACTN|nr:DUF4345 domain-containing protein [Sinosporangium siamense]GII96962.1 hypothetical protein Ssi02_71930 [Sinosporangium siamense]